ncbi:MAG: NAD+ diphosphatase [Alphaproteobacteria bacterium]|jgi:NAD+ diphosphatase
MSGDNTDGNNNGGNISRQAMANSNVFAGGLYDRAGLKRKDTAWLEGLLNHPESRVIVLWRGKHLIVGDGTTNAAPVYLAFNEALQLASGGGLNPILLGLHEERAVFCADISHHAEPLTHPSLAGRGDFFEVRDVAAAMDQTEAQLIAQARGLLYWHRRHRFCGGCGAPTEVQEAGHVRVCTNNDCAIHHFPRTDPAVIMLVLAGEKCLMGRRPGRENFMYSTLAGFVEPGESLEEAVAREVLEETNIHVANVRYAHSQPWPFPANLMLGFYADATSTEVTVNPDELADARWFTRDEVRELMAVRDKVEAAKLGGAFHLPRPISIARRLVGEWMDGRAP